MTEVVEGAGWLGAEAATLVVAASARSGPAGSSAAHETASITNTVITVSRARCLLIIR